MSASEYCIYLLYSSLLEDGLNIKILRLVIWIVIVENIMRIVVFVRRTRKTMDAVEIWLWCLNSGWIATTLVAYFHAFVFLDLVDLDNLNV